MQSFQINIPDELADKLRQYSDSNEVTMNTVMRIALDFYLQIVKRVQSNGPIVITVEDPLSYCFIVHHNKS